MHHLVRSSIRCNKRLVQGLTFTVRWSARIVKHSPSCDSWETETANIPSLGEGMHWSLAMRWGLALVQIVAMIKPFRAAAVLSALETIELLGGTVRDAMGYGRQKHRLHRYLGSEYDASFLPKVEITLFVHDHDVPAVIKAIVTHARTGRIGDGKILVLPCLDAHVTW